MKKWISVKDKLPPHKEMIIMSCYHLNANRSNVKFGYFIENNHPNPCFFDILTADIFPYGKDGKYSKKYPTHTVTITHWMPLPHPPDNIIDEFIKKKENKK